MKTIKTYKMNRNLAVLIGFLLFGILTSSTNTLSAQSSNGICERVVSETRSCDGKNTYVMYLRGPIVGGLHFRNESLQWTELDNDRIKLEGNVRNYRTGKMYVNVIMSGKSTNKSPKSHVCKDNSRENLEYYSKWEGYVQFGHVRYNIVKRGEDFQVGMNANTNSKYSRYGASGWFDITNDGIFDQGDFNLILSDDCPKDPPSDDCINTDLVKWDMNGCNPAGPAGKEMCSTNNPTVLSNGGCTKIVASAPCNYRKDFSCRPGHNGEAVCFNLRNGAVSYDVTVTPSQGKKGELTKLSLYAAAGYSNSSYYLRVYKRGRLVYLSSRRTILKNNYKLHEFDFSNDLDFKVDNETTFTFQFRGYSVMEFDDMVLEGGCCGDVEPCDVIAEAGPDKNICKGESTFIGTDGVTPGATYKWNSGQTASAITIAPTQTTTYKVTITKGECTDEDEVTVTVNNLAVDAGPNKTICKGESTVIGSDGIIPDASYLWSTGETAPLVSVNPNTSTTYSVTVTKDGCTASASVNVTVEECKKCDGFVGQTLTLKSEGGQTKDTYKTEYILVNANGIIVAIEDAPEFLPTLAGKYEVYAINYAKNENINIQIGGDLSNIDQECLDISTAVTCEVCPSDNNDDDCTDAYYDDFEKGWGVWNDGGHDSYRTYSTSTAESGRYSIRLRDNTSGSDMYTDELDFSQIGSAEVSFSFLPISFDNEYEVFVLEVSKNGGRNFDVVKKWKYGADFQNNQRSFARETIPSELLSDRTVLRIRCDASSNNDIVYIDNVTIKTCQSDIIDSDPSDDTPDDDTPDDGECVNTYIDKEDFESSLGNWYDGGSDCYRIKSSRYATTGQYSVRLRDNTTGSNLRSKIMDLSTLDELTISFDYLTEGFFGTEENFLVEVSKDGGNSYSIAANFINTIDFKNGERKSAVVKIARQLLSSNTVVRLRCDASSNSDRLYIDNLNLSSCTSASATSDDIIAQSRSIKKQFISKHDSYDFDILPNPASTVAKLDMEELIDSNVEIKIFNSIGGYVKGISLDRVSERFYTLDLDEFSGGIYMIRMRVNNDQVIIHKLNINK